jgi:hypothetical protein|eukprot:g925.t1
MGGDFSKEAVELQNSLKAAIDEGDCAKVERLIGQGAKANYIYTDNPAAPESGCTYTPLIAAVVANKPNVVKSLLGKFGADIDQDDDMGWTAFLYACCHEEDSHTTVKNMLMHKKHVVKKASHLGYTPLMLAANNAKGKIVASLIACADGDTAYINQVAIGSYGYPVSALNFACRYRNVREGDDQPHNLEDNRTSAIIRLIDAGARTNDIDQATEGFGRYPILQAMWNDDFLAMFYLITSGAETDLHMQPVGSSTQQSYPVDILYEKIHHTGTFETMHAATEKNTKEWETFHEVLFFPGRVEETAAKCKSNPNLMYHMYFQWRYNYVKERKPDLLETIHGKWEEHLDKLENTGEDKEMMDYVESKPPLEQEQLGIIYGWMEQIDSILGKDPVSDWDSRVKLRAGGDWKLRADDKRKLAANPKGKTNRNGYFC